MIFELNLTFLRNFGIITCNRYSVGPTHNRAAAKRRSSVQDQAILNYGGGHHRAAAKRWSRGEERMSAWHETAGAIIAQLLRDGAEERDA
ncbi:hypothetical protein C6495_01400 [Candidatus Poribacteria bacterium]|nr:MAG: hypothetical protein C6495_01400 [Candidatus Poribacteria bacterium]